MAQSKPELELITVNLSSTFGSETWTVKVPLDVPVSSIIMKFIQTSDLGFRERDDEGNRIPYQLMHQESNRCLGDTETLRAARVEEGHTLIMTFQARAGRSDYTSLIVHVVISITLRERP